MDPLYAPFLKKLPSQARSRAVVESILDVADERLFDPAVTDDEAVSVNDVARRAGVGIASVYDYFVDRRSLLGATVMKRVEAHLEAFVAALDRTSSLGLEDAVASVVQFAFDVCEQEPIRHRRVARLVVTLGLRRALASAQSTFVRHLAETLRQRSDVRWDDVDQASWVLVHSMKGILVALVAEEPPTDRTAARDAIVAMFVGYLSHRRA
jgi:AcrR family transcriptional regulator